ncbi:MAG: GAP family protein [Candidatus Nanopelagicales bacterium]|nr:GAP family protein [Actinomycetes bacterium]MCU0301765.1 GAP family protein [Candidatus Nanopelagicales bacterium]
MILDVLPLALAIAASPFAVVPAVLMLFTPRPRPTSAAFLAGWTLGLAAVSGGFALVADLLDDRAGTPAWAAWARIVLGLVLVVVGARQFLGRHGAAEAPAWTRSIATAQPGSAARLGLLLAVANPKILLMAAAAGLAVGADEPSTAQLVGAVAVFTAVAASTVAVPVLLYAVLGEPILRPLGAVRRWLEAHSAIIMAIVLAVIGLQLLSTGLAAR